MAASRAWWTTIRGVSIRGAALASVSLVLVPTGTVAAQSGNQDRTRPVTAPVGSTRANLGEALLEAAERGDAVAVRSLLKAGARVDVRTRNGGYTPLHVASRAGAAEVVKTLLDAGADARSLTGTGATALHLAAASGSAEAVTALIRHKAEINARETSWGQTPLMFAASENRADVVRVLLTAGADASVRTNAMDLSEEMARQQAAARRRNELLFAALPAETRDSIKAAAAKAPARGTADASGRQQAQPARQAATAATAASTASTTSAPDSARAFRIGQAAPPTDRLTPAQIQAAIEAGRELFAVKEVPKATEASASEGLEGNVSGYEATVGSMGGMTALHHAVREGNTAAALALLDGGADIDAPIAGDSTTPLLLAAINGHFDLAMQLLKRGADVRRASTAGLTALYAVLNVQWAPKSRYPQPQSVQVQKTTHLELMQAIIAAGADVNVRLKKNLWFFAFNNCGNANCGLETLDGTTPFWRAAYAVDLDAMRMLKAAGAIDSLPSFRVAPAGRARAAARGGAAGGAAGAGGPDGPGSASGAVDAETDSAAKAVPPGIGVYPIHAAAGVGYGNGFAGNSHHHAPDGWMPAMRYLVEELHADVNQRDLNGYTPLHHAAARGDNEMILYLVSKGADVKAVARNGRTTVDMANGPVQRLRPFPETIQLLEKLGAKNSHRCVSC